MNNYFYIIKVMGEDGSWHNNAFIEKCYDAIKVALFYRNQLCYQVQLWHEEKDVSWLLDFEIEKQVIVKVGGIVVDDHMYDGILSYAERELLPQFRIEYLEHGSMSACPSYQEVKSLCKALNAVAPYAGYNKVSPKDFVVVS